MNQIDIVDKLDDAFKKFNQRILEVDQGRIRYYSKPPPNFSQENLQLNQKPKAGFELHLNRLLFASIVDIIDAHPRISSDLHPRSIAFTFYSNQLLAGSELNKSQPILPKPKPPLQTWVFLFRDIESREKWCETFAINLQRQENPTASVKQFIENQLQQLEKLSPDQAQEQLIQEQQINEEEKIKNETKVRSAKFEQLRANMKLQEISRKKKEEEFNRQRKQQQEEEQKRQNQQREEEEKRRREEEQRNLRREQERQMKMKIQTAWEFRYFQALEDCQESCDNFDNSMKAGLKLVKYIETFKEQAMITVKQLISDLLDKKITVVNLNQSVNFIEEENQKKVIIFINQTIFSKPKKKQQQLNEQANYTGSFQDCYQGVFQFQQNNLLIQIAASEAFERTLLVPNKSLMIQSLNLQNLDMPFYFGLVHSNQKKRQLSDEFKSLNYVNDICFAQRLINKYFKLKVPLGCQIEYLGFKALVIAVPPSPLDESSLTYGVPQGESFYKTSQKLELEIEALGRSLAIKPHCFMWKVDRFDPKKIQLDTKRSVIQLSVNTQIHSGNIVEFEQLKAQIKMYADQESEQEVRRQGLFYLFRVKELLPFIIEENYSELIEQANKTFPQNSNFEHLLSNYEFRRTRPEFLTVYFDTGVSGQLRAQQNNIQNRKLYNPDAYDTIEESNDITYDQLTLAEMSKSFIRAHIQEFVNKVDSLEICLIDSYSIRESFKLFGINIRFLSLVAQLTKIPHVQQLCEIEMMARSIKNIFNQQFTEYLQTITEDQIPYKPFDPKKLIKEPLSDQEDFDIKRNFSKKQSIMLPRTIIQEREAISDYIEQQYKEQIADLLNLVFSKSNVFYEQIVFKQVLFDFNYDLNPKLKGICPGSLLSALQFNLKFESKFEPKDIVCGTPYASIDESAIFKFNLKQYLHSKTYQQVYKQSMIPASSQMTPLTTPPTKGAQSLKFNKQVLFDASSIIQIRFDVQSYSLLEVEICKLVNKFNIFKLQQNYQLAIKVLHIRLNLLDGLEHSCNVSAAKTIILTDLAELHFKQKQYQQAMNRITEALKQINPTIVADSENLLNQLSNMNQRLMPRIGMIRPLILLLEIVVDLYQDYVFIVFDLLIFNLEFCLGSQHHYYAKVFNIMGIYFKNKGLMDDMLQMNTMQIICLIKTIGHQHQLTAEAYIEIGEQKQSPEQQILFYEKAFYIFETLYTENSLQTAYVACKLTKGYTECGKINEAIKVSALGCKILKTKAQDNLAFLLELSYYRSFNFYKINQKEQARKECEEFFNVLILYLDQLQAYEQQQEQNLSDLNQSSKELQSFPNQFVEMTRNTLRTFTEIFLSETSKEHRNFLYQMFDLIVEDHARNNQLEVFDSQFNQQFAHVLKKIKQLGSLQAYLEWSLIQFVDKTGGDVNWLTFNFKAQTSELLKEPYDNYECIIASIGRKTFNQIFDRVMMHYAQ